MNLRFKTNLLEHTKAVGRWAAAHGARASMDAIDMTLTVQRGGRTCVLQPQFVGKRDGEHLSYFPQADQHAQGFVGWLPYAPQSWDVSLSKLAFKAAMHELGLATPAHGLDPAAVDAPFLVKRARGAFGYGMRGPFLRADAGSIVLAEGEYCEAFHWGRIARAWYWNGRLAVLEVFAMPSVVGDGVSRYEALLRAASAELPADFEQVARLQGVHPADVLPAGLRVVCDYRYVSPFNPTVYANANALPAADSGGGGAELAERFRHAGRQLWPRIPGPPGRQLGFVLDAIVDAHDRPWFLEVNSNAQGHPDLYAPMLDAWFGIPAASEPALHGQSVLTP